MVRVPLAATCELLDGARRRAPLGDVEVRRRLVEEVDVGPLHEHLVRVKVRFRVRVRARVRVKVGEW